MAGINRLGKAPPRPGTLRPPDPNRYRAVDFYSQDAEGDADYMRMVRDIENSQQQHGWLSGRGAFDKSDLLFLRDEEEKRRCQELQRREQERQQFAILKAKAEADLKQPSKESVQLGKRNRQDKFMKLNAIRLKVKEKDKDKNKDQKPSKRQKQTVHKQPQTRQQQEDSESDFEHETNGVKIELNPFQGLVDCYGSDEDGEGEKEADNGSVQVNNEHTVADKGQNTDSSTTKQRKQDNGVENGQTKHFQKDEQSEDSD
eukprot:TRINITY_DN3991_c2_g1_i1.p3 TRINITY_DN3991_c2_g1~~TRINITY_DN3991_c2_g1_i1.p3  ORF type:complete len:258 (-),score=38.74 TRINITY_DN3991_c2_g1_i1:275-1048(-)